MAKKDAGVARPLKKSEYEIRLATSSAARGWSDLLATQRASAVDAWDRLTKDPLHDDARCHRLKGVLATVSRGGEALAQRQYELSGGARIWFVVDHQSVLIVQVHTHHPNQTK